uniref:Neutral cholesterol ester hydrolase 1 n=1 Tax=Poecilia reticulata TaxID=8081 RepID=A0A3P9P8A0_POERE
MGLKAVVVTVLLAAALSYYVYNPMPDAIQEPWKLMAVDAAKYFLLNKIKQRSLFISFMFKNQYLIDITFAGVPVRVYEPPAGGEGHLRRGLLYLHGGGWAFGSGKMGAYDKVSRMISDELNTVVVSVEYRLFPEVLFPEPFLDCVAAAKHFLSPEVLDKYAIDPERVAVSGDSAGGNLAAAVAQEVLAEPKCDIVQALIYPVLQALDFNTPSYVQNRNMAILPRQVMVQFWLQYLGADISLQPQLIANNHSALQHSVLTPELRSRLDWTSLLSQKFKKSYKPVVAERDSHGLLKKIPGLLDARSSPLLAGPEVLAKCPRAYILTCEFDVLRDDGLMYARRLKDAGVAVTSDYYEDGFHGCLSFTSWPLDFDVGKRVLRNYMTWLQNNL